MSEDKDWPRKKYASEHERKCHKPILEKKRRARINKSLDQLKSLLLETVKGEGGHYSKLEKADILEMTVKHLKELQSQQLQVAMVMDPSVVRRYESGFSECASEVSRYLSTIDSTTPQVTSRLMDHLSNCSNNVQSNVPVYTTTTSQAQGGVSVLGVNTSNGQLNAMPIRVITANHQTPSTVQPMVVHSIVGPISPPLYGRILNIGPPSNESTQKCKLSPQQPGSDVHSTPTVLSTSPIQETNRSGHVTNSLYKNHNTQQNPSNNVNNAKQMPIMYTSTPIRPQPLKRKPEATVTRQSLSDSGYDENSSMDINSDTNVYSSSSGIQQGNVYSDVNKYSTLQTSARHLTQSNSVNTIKHLTPNNQYSSGYLSDNNVNINQQSGVHLLKQHSNNCGSFIVDKENITKNVLMDNRKTMSNNKSMRQGSVPLGDLNVTSMQTLKQFSSHNVNNVNSATYNNNQQLNNAGINTHQHVNQGFNHRGQMPSAFLRPETEGPMWRPW